MDLRIMTFNIQHGLVHMSNPGRIDLSVMAEVIRNSGADIIGLNEVRGRGINSDYTAQAEELGNILGFHSWFGRSFYVGGWNPYGNAVLSRFPIIETKIIRIPDPCDKNVHRFEPRSITRAVTEYSEGKYFAVYSSHFGLSDIEQEHASATAASVLRDEPLPCAFMGDFNVTPDNKVLEPVRGVMKGTDAFLENKFSHPSDNPKNRIDFIFVSENVTVKSADVIDIIASDHCPVVADISVN